MIYACVCKLDMESEGLIFIGFIVASLFAAHSFKIALNCTTRAITYYIGSYPILSFVHRASNSFDYFTYNHIIRWEKVYNQLSVTVLSLTLEPHIW